MSKRVLTHATPEQRTEESPPLRRTAAPMVVGAADDFAERDADRVAHEVLDRLAGPDELPEHVHDGCHGEPVRRAASGGAPAGAEVGFDGGELSEHLSSRIEAARGKGQTLPDPVRRRMEAGFGRSLAKVRLHTGSEAAGLARSVSARAFTTGQDIFFGDGEYSPETPAGERVLAHEIAHTQQQSAGARRLQRLWNFSAPRLPIENARRIGVVSSGQSVYFLHDADDDTLVVKSEDRETGLSNLSADLQEALGGVKAARQRDLPARDAARLTAIISTDGATQLDQAAWTKLGATMRNDPGAMTAINGPMGRALDTPLDDMTDLQIAQAFHAEKLTRGRLVAQPFAGKHTGIQATESADPNAMQPERNRMRALLMDYKHLENLGRLTAVDLFFGNADRVLGGNIGNWIYDPYTAAMTTIDHVDSTVSDNFQKPISDAEFAGYLDELKSSKLRQTADTCAKRLMFGLEDRGGDKGAMAWAKADGGWRLETMSEGIERGLHAGRAQLIKTFTSSRFSMLTSKGRQARATKKSLKASAATAAATDGGGNDYYQMLKARAAWLKKN